MGPLKASRFAASRSATTVALVLTVGTADMPGRSSRGVDFGGLLRDQGLLQLDLGIEIAHRGFGRRDVGPRLVQRCAEIAVIDPGEQLACPDRLVVGNQHLGDVARDPRRDDRGVGFDVGVVGRLEIAAGGKVVVAEIGAPATPRATASASAARLIAWRDGVRLILAFCSGA
jgi:hypothetical protein